MLCVTQYLLFFTEDRAKLIKLSLNQKLHGSKVAWEYRSGHLAIQKFPGVGFNQGFNLNLKRIITAK